ncbi:MAG: acetylornithine deacetylase/succinyl-diaminopimelate desuccinylase-like protein, partial [Saprospiraceae bacterium]
MSVLTYNFYKKFTMQKVQSYIQENKQRFLDELMELLKVPSISADAAYAEHTNKTADIVADSLKKAGADNVEICQTAGYPIVYADKIVSASLPTVLVYGHYDVQPPDPLD